MFMEKVDYKAVLARTGILLIKEALIECKGNKAHASKLLSMNRTTLVMKLKSAGLLKSEEIEKLKKGHVSND